MIDIELLAKELKRDEGFREQVYTCSAGKQTIGFGHNLEDGTFPEIIAEKLLHFDMGQTIRDCERLVWFYDLNGVRKRVIINMAFNLGITRLSGFKKMIQAIEAGDWNGAADEMENSKWFGQVGDRAVRLCRLMREG